MQKLKQHYWVLLGFFCVAIFSHSLTAATDLSDPSSLGKIIEPNNVPYLEADYARMRAHQVKDIHYNLTMNLDEVSTDYSGQVSIDFSLVDNNQSPLRVDFEGGEVKSLRLNGQAITWKTQKWFLLIGAESLKPGKNHLEIQFTHAYTTTGDGLHRYKDQPTGNVYLYSNFEPFNAHKMFPHFDQPNLKAVFKLSVIAPRHWTVVSTEMEKTKRKQGSKMEWKFPATAPISSYVFSLHAGDYKVWNDRLGKMPLRLLARKEIAKQVDYKEWFKVTKESFTFYNNYFEYTYPFKKYDQLVVPDFNSGAMENVGAVTFNEHYTPPTKKSWIERMRTASVISHEMAHMWFGDLVTMDWWNGLWLNESFATYMSALQQSENSEFKNESWFEFYLRMKQWGYQEDQLVTTHPIELTVANTEEAFTNFDGITYGKGAAVLRQLAHYVGEQNFRKGVGSYLKKHAYANASLQDFMAEIEIASGKDLSQWSQHWLYSASLNTLTADFSCAPESGVEKINRFELVQTAKNQYPQLREHKLDLGLLKAKEGKILLTKKIPIDVDGTNTAVAAAVGEECPDLAYPNLNDWGYVKVSLDKKSKAFLLDHINEFEKPIKMMLWQNLWDDVLDAKMPVTEYIQFVKKSLQSEKEDKQTALNMEKLVISAAYLTKIQSSGQNHQADLAMIENTLLEKLQSGVAGSDMQRNSFNLYLSVVRSPEGLANIRSVFLGEPVFKGLVVDQDLRWRILIALNHYGYKDYESLTQAETAKDQSDYGQQMATASNAVRADVALKEKWVNEILSPNSKLKYATQKLVLFSLFPDDQDSLRASFEERIISALPELVSRNSDRFISSYARSTFMPGECNDSGLKKLISLRDHYSTLSPTLKKALSVNVQEEERCIAMKKLMDEPSIH